MIARVFPRKTNMSPTDADAYFGVPDIFTPKYDEVHISVTFTWDISQASFLCQAWRGHAPLIKMGGPAYDDKGNNFWPGRYVRKGVAVTSRGCPNNCSFCFVPKREGRLRELPVTNGNNIIDNNLLACSKTHLDGVFTMLSHQRRIDFSGGLEASRITDEIVDRLRGLRIYQIWLAYDTENADKPLVKAIKKLSKYFRRDQLRCYVLIGYKDDTLEKAETRLRKAWEIGTLPFAMRYRTSDPQWQGTFLYKDRAWNLLTRQWTRPAIIKTRNKTQGLIK